VYSLLHHLNANLDKTIILIEHQVDELIQYATRIIIMEGGRIVANGKPKDVLASWARRLETDLGLWVPEITRLAMLAEDLGHPMRSYPVSVEEAAAAWAGLPLSKDRKLSNPGIVDKASPEDTFLKLNDVSFTYPSGNAVLHDIDLEIREGDVVGLMGENGSGKTTLSRHFIGLLRATSGKILMENRDVAEMKVRELARDVGYVFQYPEHQFVADNVYDEVAYTPRLEGKTGDELEETVRRAMAQVGIDKSLDHRHPFTLSMGEKRRLSIATVLVRLPRMLILDEPTAGLDYRNTERMMDILGELNRQGTTIMLVTHTTYLVAKFARHVSVMDLGKIVFDGTPRDLFHNLEKVDTRAIDKPEMLKVVTHYNQTHPEKMFPFMTVDEVRASLNGSRD